MHRLINKKKLWKPTKLDIAGMSVVSFLLMFLLATFTLRYYIDNYHTDQTEYDIYSIAIKELYINDRTSMIVIKDYTRFPYYLFQDKETYDNLIDRVPGLSDETFRNFHDKNKFLIEFPLTNYGLVNSFKLHRQFNLSLEYKIVDPDDLKEIFEPDLLAGWKKFYEVYPGSQGNMKLSRVGFNSTRDQALLYIGNTRHWLAGKGWLILFTRKDGKWIITFKEDLWIS